MLQYVLGINHSVNNNRNSYERRVRDAIKDKVSVIDVDGSYLVRKHEQLHQAGVKVAPLGPPSLPLSGWITINIRMNPQRFPNSVARYTDSISPMHIRCSLREVKRG